MTFRFNAERHEYLDEAGRVLPHITGMLKICGLVDDRWFTEEHSHRGQEVHRLTADYDLGALEDVVGLTSPYKGYLQAYVKAMALLRPEFLAIEEPRVHPVFRYGGRTDRELVLNRVLGVMEIKAAVPSRAHPIQTALQAILIEPIVKVPAEALYRWTIYLSEDGRFTLERHQNPQDFVRARAIIRQCCGSARA